MQKVVVLVVVQMLIGSSSASLNSCLPSTFTGVISREVSMTAWELNRALSGLGSAVHCGPARPVVWPFVGSRHLLHLGPGRAASPAAPAAAAACTVAAA